MKTKEQGSLRNEENYYSANTLALIFKRTFVRYWSLTLVGAMHWVTIPNSERFFFFQGPGKFRTNKTLKKFLPKENSEKNNI